MARLSACLIVKDEAELLPGCLASLKGWVDEVVVVDTGSTDATVAIAEAAGARVLHQPWADDFSAPRNAAIEAASGAWILIVDADERLVVEDPQALEGILNGPVAAHAFAMVNEGFSEQSPHRVVRLFPRDPHLRYRGRIHEGIGHDLGLKGWPLREAEGLHFLHLGYLSERVHARDKQARNLRLSRLEWAEHPDKAYAAFCYARSALSAGALSEATLAWAQLEGLLAQGQDADPYGPQYLGMLRAMGAEAAKRAQAQDHAALGALTGLGGSLLAATQAEGMAPSLTQGLLGLAVQLRPQDPEPWALAGQLAWAAEDQEGARQAWGEAVARDPGHWVAEPLQKLGGPLAPRTRLSACLIVKDEAESLPACLASLKGWVDEVVVVDTGSTDGTVAIAQAAGAVVGHFPWCDDFSAARNHALGLATGDWVLTIDADERLSVLEPKALVAALEDPAAWAYLLPLENLDEAGRVASRLLSAPRLFRRDERIRYEGRLHEDVSPSLARLGHPSQRLGALLIQHLGYTEAILAAKDKLARNRRLAELQSQERPEDPNAWLQLAAIASRQGDHEAALPAVARARQTLQGGRALAPHRRASLSIIEAAAHRAQGRAEVALATLNAAWAEGLASPELAYERGQALAQAGQRAEAQAAFEACLALGRSGAGEGTARAGLGGFLCHVELMALHLEGGDLAAGARHAAAAAADPACPPEEAARLAVVAQQLARGAEAAASQAPAASGPAPAVDPGAPSVPAAPSLPAPPPAPRAAEPAQDPMESREAALAVLRQDERRPDGWLALAVHEREAQALDKALVATAQCLRLDAGLALAWFFLGVILAELGEPRLADRAMALVLRLEPEHPTAQAQRVALRAHPLPEHSPPDWQALMDELEALLSPRLSLCMIVKDESPRVARAIRSAASWVDEIVVVDTGSTDGTVAIAEAEGARVLSFQWQRDFSAARNAAIEAATGDWILMLDADEVLVVASPEHLRRQLLDRSLAGRALSIVDVDPLGQAQGAESPSLRLFQRLPGLRYAGRLHESLAASLEALGLQVGETKALRLNHHGHQAKVVLEKDKALRNLELARLDHQDAPDDFRSAFKLAVAEAQAGQAVAALERLVALNEAQAGGIHGLPDRLWAQVILVWAQVAWTAGDAIQAEDLMDQALERLPGFPPFLLTRGRLRAARWDLSSAAADFRACLGQAPGAWEGHVVLESLGDGPALAELARLGLGARPGEAAPATEAAPSPPPLGAGPEAAAEAALPSKEEALALLAQDEQDTAAWLLLAFRCQEAGDAAGALEAVGEALRQDASAASGWITLAQALESLGLPRQAARAWQCLQQLQPDHASAAAERTRLRGLDEAVQLPEALAEWLEATLDLVAVRVSACLIVKDEAERLGACLEALAPWVDEVVVVDTGSTDATVAIAEAAGARVLHHPWQDDFAAARNVALDAAQHGWCLVVDADERLVVADEAAWYAALRHRKALAYALTVEDLDEHGELALRFGAVRLLQRHPQLRYSGRLHESVSPALQALGATAHSLPSVRLRHDGHHTQAMLARGKAARNRRIAQREAAERPESAEAMLKLAASELGLVPAEASLAAFQALEAKGWAGLGAPTTAHAIGLQVRLMKDMGLEAGAEALLDAALQRFGAFPDLHLERAASRAKRGALALAAEDLRACLAGQGVDFGAFAVRQGATDALPRAALRQLGLPEAGPLAPEALGGWSGGLGAEGPAVAPALGGSLPGAPAAAGPTAGSALAGGSGLASGLASAPVEATDPVAEAKAMLAEDPRNEQAWLALAWHSFQAGALDKALVALHQHLLLQAGRPAGWALLGMCLAHLGLPRWAERAWRQALRWDPDHPSARQQLQALHGAPEAEAAPPELAERLEAMLALGQPRLSACLIVKDEEANLPRCLASLQGWADEVVVVDTGSTDGTVAIAEAFGAKVGHFAWTGDFSEARNASFALATGDWVLVIDADEELEVPDSEAFHQALAFRVPVAYVAPLVNLDAQGEPMGEVALLRLVQRVPGLRMSGALHESFAEAIHELGWPVMGSDDFRLRHHGYALGLEASQAKGRRNLGIAEAELARLGPSPERWLNLMRSAHLAGEGARAREALRALQAAGGAAALVDVHLGLWAASAVQILREDGDLAGALALVDAALARLPEVADFWLARAELRQALGDLAGARADLEAVLGLPPHHLAMHPNPKGAAQAALASLPPAPRPTGLGVPEALAAPPSPASDDLLSAAEAKAKLAEDPRDAIAWLALAFHSWQEGALDKALVALQQHLMVDASRPAAWALFGMCLTDLGLPRWAERAWALALAWDPEHPTARQQVVALRQQDEAEAPPPEMAARLEGMLALGRPRLSACLIVKNEAANLPRCLEALRPWVDEIVVVDTGSTDQTVAIAGSFGATLGHFAWTGDFSAARNHAFGLASGDWLFVVDADEELVVEDPAGLRRLLAQRTPAAYALPLVNLGAQGQAEGRLHLLRLVQNLPGLRMTGALHENFAEAIQALGWPVWATEALHLLHHGYAQGAADLMAKGERNLGVAEEELTRLGPSAERLLNVARSALLAGARRRAGEAFAQIWSGGWAKALHDVHLVLLVGSHTHLLRGDGALEEALAVVEAGLARLPELPDFLLERGALRRDLGDWPGAIADFEAAEALPRHLMTLRVDHVAEAQAALRALRQPLPNPRRVSACLIVKDEAERLARCLRSLKPWVDEIVVVDTGSTDDTVAIAEAFGAKVGHFPWCDDFSAARNHALSLATGHWALSVDADELLWVADAEAWRQALGHPDPQVGAFVFPILNRQAEGGAVVSPMLRLFRLDERVRYEGRLHEEVVANLEEAGYAVCPLQGVQICHDGYLPEVVEAREKHPRNLRLAIAETEDHPDRPLAWYNLARSALFTSDTDTVIQALAQVARLLAEGRRMGEAPYCGYVLLQRRLWMAQGKVAECEALLDEGLQRVEGFVEFHYERGLLRRARGAIALAIADFEACLRPSGRYHTAPVRPEIAGLWAPAQLAELRGLAPDAIPGGGA